MSVVVTTAFDVRIMGVADVVGEGVTAVAPGDRVVALINFGGHAEYICRPAEKRAPVPAEFSLCKQLLAT